MKNSETKTKLRAVLKAAIWGVALFDVPTLILLAAIIICRHTGNSWLEFFNGIAFIFSIPYISVVSVTGDSFLVNQLTVNGLLGAIIFAVISSCRQFVFKKNHEAKN
jgi:hypothetical protein